MHQSSHRCSHGKFDARIVNTLGPRTSWRGRRPFRASCDPRLITHVSNARGVRRPVGLAGPARRCGRLYADFAAGGSAVTFESAAP